MFPIRWNEIFRKKDGTLGTMEDLGGGGGGSELPAYSSADAGKVLGVNEEGSLEWVEVTSYQNRYQKVQYQSVKTRETRLQRYNNVYYMGTENNKFHVNYEQF